jgi:alpha-aminoadipate carrier protein LysW
LKLIRLFATCNLATRYFECLFYAKKEFFTMSLQAECPECGADISLSDDVMEGEIVQCAECGAELEVISLNPPTLDLAPEEEEDWGE